MYADSSGPEFQSAIELGCEMALPFPFLDVMLVKKLQVQLYSPGKLLKKDNSVLKVTFPYRVCYGNMGSRVFKWDTKLDTRFLANTWYP